MTYRVYLFDMSHGGETATLIMVGQRHGLAAWANICVTTQITLRPRQNTNLFKDTLLLIMASLINT